MNIGKIRRRTKRFLKRRPEREGQAKKTLAKFPRWKDDTSQQYAVETLIILYDTYRGGRYKMDVPEAYHEAIRIYSQRWVDWRGTTDKGGDEDGQLEADSEIGN